GNGSLDIILLISSPYGDGKWYGILEGLNFQQHWTLITDGSWITDGSQITSGYRSPGSNDPEPPLPEGGGIEFRAYPWSSDLETLYGELANFRKFKWNGEDGEPGLVSPPSEDLDIEV